MTIDKKLEEYLSIHCINLSKPVREFIQKSQNQELTDEEAISSLGLVAFERKKFMKSLASVEQGF